MRLDQLPTPALLLDLDILERNLARMQATADRDGVRLRPHIKTHKCLEIARRQRALGAHGITVSTRAELEVFARAGFTDITWALPNPLAHLDGVLALPEEVTVRLLVDDRSALEVIARRAQAAGRRLHLWMKVDCGLHRAGVDPESPVALELLEALLGARGIVFDGILTHAGHAYHAHSRDGLRRIAAAEREIMLNFATRARSEGLEVREISIGSTPTLSVADTPGALEGVHEIRPGNYVFYDRTQVALGACELDDCALTVLASVISHQPGAHHVVTDAGALALSKDTGPDHLPGQEDMGLVFSSLGRPSPLEDVRVSWLSQEHGVLVADGGDRLDGRFPVGARLRILENHSCLTAAQFDEYCVVQGEEVVARWPIERRRL